MDSQDFRRIMEAQKKTADLVSLDGMTLQAYADAFVYAQARIAALEEVIRQELESLSPDTRTNSSHWDGCEQSHPRCAAIKRMQAALEGGE